MTRRRRRDHRGHDPSQLYTREERARAKLLVRDLQRQLARCTEPRRTAELRGAIDGIRAEQAHDREVSARRPKRNGRQP